MLKREVAVQKSAWAPAGSRPTVSTHYASMSAEPDFEVGERIVIVDDVVTKGSTALAAASRIAELYPDSSVVLFALIRTKGLVPDIEQIIEPVSGVIHLVDDEGSRNP
jgi:adenine/guanine phosphoribosyltransferase-like PRPP-binding protein